MTRADALTSLLSAAELGLLRVRHGLIVEANETASALLDMAPQALVGMALHDAPQSAGTVFTDLCDLHDRVLAAGALPHGRARRPRGGGLSYPAWKEEWRQRAAGILTRPTTATARWAPAPRRTTFDPLP